MPCRAAAVTTRPLEAVGMSPGMYVQASCNQFICTEHSSPQFQVAYRPVLTVGSARLPRLTAGHGGGVGARRPVEEPDAMHAVEGKDGQ